MEIWIASSNKNKIDEMAVVLKPLECTLKSFKDLGSYSSPKEDGKTFEDNALIKARSLKSIRNKDWVIGEDSGLEVVGMNGLPGIHSARYAGEKASDMENVTKLLKMINIKGVMDKSAQFVATIVAFSPSGEKAVFRGEMKGQIAKAPRGTTGFGYDNVFIPEGQDKTLAELGPGFKIQNSHRTKALVQFMTWLKSQPGN